MMTLQKMLADYLRRIGQLEPQPLGNAPQPLSPDDSMYLRESLARRLRFNDWMIVISIALLCGVFILESFLIYQHRGSLNAEVLISSSGFAGLMAIVDRLRRLWLEKSAMDFLTLTTASLPPAEAARLVTSFYFKSIQTRGRTVARGA